MGKTTTSAAFAMGLAERGFKTVVIDFDVGLRNLDLIMGCERRVVYDFVNVIQGEANVGQALIKDKRNPNLFILPASQTRDKDAQHRRCRQGAGGPGAGVRVHRVRFTGRHREGRDPGDVLRRRRHRRDQPEVSSVRDSDRMIGILSSKSRAPSRTWKASVNSCWSPVIRRSRCSAVRCWRSKDVQEILSLELIGVIPESTSVLNASNSGSR